MTRILIVEDENKVRSIYHAMLKNEGFDVLEAPNAMEASVMLNREPVDIMLLDIKMPQVFGSVFYDMMQNFHKHVQVIVASVYPVDEQKKMIKGAADYYDKSQGVDLLLEKIKKVEKIIKGKISILVVDDEPKIRQIYRYYLQEHGYRVLEASDGNAGIEILRKNGDIALVILDLAMPRQSGFEIHDSMKREFPGVKILVASVFPERDQKFFLPGADDHYDKSEDAAGLMKKIEQLISADSPA
ncbi:MAG TPA: response regulator [Candidatus Omnitrophota bacterium]|mgnify:CR=1 FL=1|nr:response regulator [Candidatus Omnitrophota bacterium]HQJ14952.1 response regulator [Candidatus Omnitrophota bacterium]